VFGRPLYTDFGVLREGSLALSKADHVDVHTEAIGLRRGSPSLKLFLKSVVQGQVGCMNTPGVDANITFSFFLHKSNLRL